MATVKSNIWNLKVGDIITFTNRAGAKWESLVVRVEEKSWYSGRPDTDTQWRKSYGSLHELSKFPDFKIIRKQD